MAAQSSATNSHANPYLSRNQQVLLFAALNSQAGDSHYSIKRSDSDPDNLTMSAVNGNALSMSPPNADLDNFDVNLDHTPGMDYLDGDSGFDFENADFGDDMIGALPNRSDGSEDAHPSTADGHEKRKSPDEAGDSEEGDAKRQETQEGEKSVAKKPGRKPLTSEPTTKRKAQNRAAQRAFRERKEKHLKDLETKVTELSKAQEADKHENGLLKAQVERLQVELRDYRKRLSLNSASVNRSPGGQQRSSSASSYGGNFDFDFPKFGGLLGSQMLGDQGISNGPSPTSTSARPQAQDQVGVKTGRSLSPKSSQASYSSSATAAVNLNNTFAPYSTNNNMHGFANTLPQMNGAGDPFGDLFTPGVLKSASQGNYFEKSQVATAPISGAQKYNSLDHNGGETTAGLNRVFQFNGGSNASDSTSPSNSSGWNINTGNSSCGTSPAPSHDSPATKDKNIDSFTQKQYAVDASFAGSNLQSGTNATFADFNVPSQGNFDPVLFGDYRESNDAIVGGGNFTGGFFDDALLSAPFDFNSPSNLFGILQSPQHSHAALGSAANEANPSRNLMAEVEKTRNGGDDDSSMPTKAERSGKMVSCNKIWTELQTNPDFVDGKFDLDGLCQELSAKAKCSESGMMVEKEHVDAALRSLGQQGNPRDETSPALIFEQNSWENVLKKLRGNKA